MEADWEVEIGGDAPVIDACWKDLVDLRRTPELAAELPEARQFPALAGLLVQLNSESSPFRTSKCDVWSPEGFDPDELDAQREDEKCAFACYIDLLPRRDLRWSSPEEAVAASRVICERLHNEPLRCCRADLVIRQAHIAPDREDLGITAYLMACGSTLAAAQAMLESALGAFVSSVVDAGYAGGRASKLQ